MKHKLSSLEPDCIYHIYNRANGNERLFHHDENYQFFLERFKLYLAPVVDVFCYCLMPNHFHLLVRVKSEEILKEFFKDHKLMRVEAFPKFGTLEKLISKQFSNLFSSYTQAFNKQQNRRGSLFMKNFNRLKVTQDFYFKKLVHYIHYNPVEGGLCQSPKDWSYSSYPALISHLPTALLRKELLTLFHNRDNFIYCHHSPPDQSGINDLF